MANIFSFRHRRTAKKTSRPVFVTKTTAWRNHFRRVSLFVFVSIGPDYGTKRVMVLVGPFLRRPVVMYISPNRFSGSTREVSALSADRIAGVTFRDVTLPPPPYLTIDSRKENGAFERNDWPGRADWILRVRLLSTTPISYGGNS